MITESFSSSTHAKPHIDLVPQATRECLQQSSIIDGDFDSDCSGRHSNTSSSPCKTYIASMLGDVCRVLLAYDTPVR
ncbi:hypothetical protein HZ326_6759 [Fusarium oxysporum f. sp. albedinis]|nr:hypothetical protein HZ326_6759 [Fusarium oxysporum f. sp. albedinis]